MSLPRPAELRFADRAAQAEALAASVAAGLEKRLADGGEATLVVPGGTTPGPFLDALAARPLPWGRLWVTLTDERWVPQGDPASNEGALRRRLVGSAASERVVGLYTGDATPEAGQAATEARLRGLPRPFALVVLGMGEDGHVASLFPGAPGLSAALEPAGDTLSVASRPPGTEPRLSLTLAALLDAERIVLLLNGETKWRAYETALAGGLAAEMPVRAVLRRARVSVEVWWAP